MPRTATLVVPAADRWSDDAGRAVVTAFVSSGQSPTEFSRQHGIDVQRLYRWRRRLGLEATVTQAPAFIEVTPRPDTPVEIVLRSGRVLRVPASIDPRALARFVEVLEC